MSVPVQIAIAVVSWNDQFLIGQRGEGRELAGYWEFPGGKMHADETPAAAAERECLEETGLCVTAIDTYLDQVHEYDYGQLHLHFIRCQVEPSSANHPPLAPFRWVPRAELGNYEFPAGNQRVLELVARG